MHLGDDVTREDLLASYDAVVYATGAMRDRRMGIPGEDLPGSYAATDFVNWYCGHPDIDPGAFTLDAESVAVVGVGNVAVDVARILVRDPDELRATDMPQPVLEALMASKVREVHMIGRRGPAQAKFTTKELRELGELAGVDIVVAAGETDLDAFDPTGQSAALADERPPGARQLAVIRDWAGRRAGRGRAPADHPVLAAPGRDAWAQQRVSGLTLERTRLDDDGPVHRDRRVRDDRRADGAAQRRYQSVPLAGVPFDERTSTVPNAEGRVLGPDGAPLPGEYVAGWLKRGPTGVIGTNKSDAAQTVRSLLADLAGGPDARRRRARAGRAAFAEQLAARGVRPVTYRDWLRLEAAEKALGSTLGRGARVKVAGRAAIEALCRPSGD